VPDARFVDVEGSGHVIYAERPDEFENALRTFAGELDRRPTPST
jgi:3-oxoadipate enol-lactonase